MRFDFFLTFLFKNIILINVTLLSRKMNYFNLLSAFYVPNQILDAFLSQLPLNLKKKLKFWYMFCVVQSILGNYCYFSF